MEHESILRENLLALRELNGAQRTLVEDCLSILESMDAAGKDRRRKPASGKTRRREAPKRRKPSS